MPNRPMTKFTAAHPDDRLTPTGRLRRAKKGELEHGCVFCGKVYTRNEHLKRHQNKHKPGTLKCDAPGCDCTFHNFSLLEKHKLNQWPFKFTANPDTLFRCPSSRHRTPDEIWPDKRRRALERSNADNESASPHQPIIRSREEEEEEEGYTSYGSMCSPAISASSISGSYVSAHSPRSTSAHHDRALSHSSLDHRALTASTSQSNTHLSVPIGRFSSPSPPSSHPMQDSTPRYVSAHWGPPGSNLVQRASYPTSSQSFQTPTGARLSLMQQANSYSSHFFERDSYYHSQAASAHGGPWQFREYETDATGPSDFGPSLSMQPSTGHSPQMRPQDLDATHGHMHDSGFAHPPAQVTYSSHETYSYGNQVSTYGNSDHLGAGNGAHVESATLHLLQATSHPGQGQTSSWQSSAKPTSHPLPSRSPYHPLG